MNQGMKAVEAEEHVLDISTLSDLNEDQKTLVETISTNGQIKLYTVPGNNIFVPRLSTSSDAVDLIHVMNMKVMFTTKWGNCLKVDLMGPCNQPF